MFTIQGEGVRSFLFSQFPQLAHAVSSRGALKNRRIFRAADEDGAIESANFLGQKLVIKKTWGFAQGRKTYHYSEQEEHKLKPHELRGLAKHTCILVHAELGFRKTLIRPIEPDGTVCEWF